jgi:hypothetical protein
MTLAELLQIVGALAVLVPFAWSQLGTLRTDTASYLWLNLAGSGLLAALALHDRQWGFLLLEGVWALVALRGVVLRGRARLASK